MTDTDPTSPTCIRCGEPVASDALRCPHCSLTFPALQDLGDRDGDAVIGDGAPPTFTSSSPPPTFTSTSPLPPPAAPLPPTPSPPRADPDPTVPPHTTGAPPPATADDGRHDTAPQPIFPPGPADQGGGLRTRLLVAAAVVLLAGVGVVLMTRGGDDPVADGPPPVAELAPPSFELRDDGLDMIVEITNLADGDRVRMVVGDEQIDESSGPSPVALRWSGAPEGVHRIVVQVRRADEQTDTSTDVVVPPAVPGVESFDGWIMGLASLEQPEQADRYAAGLEGIDDARILRSDDWPSLNPGYWVVYVGPFATGEEVLARCAELGREVPRDCVGRVLTRNPDDRSIIAN